MSLRIKHIALLLLCSVSLQVCAQHFNPWFEVGVKGGGMNYIGDLNNQSLFGTVHPAAGAFLRYMASSRWAFLGGFNMGTVSGGNPDVNVLRNLSFSSPIKEMSFRAEFNFVPYGDGGNLFATTPYIFAGLGYFWFDPTATYIDPATHEERSVRLQPLGTEGQAVEGKVQPYALGGLVMPFGLGFRWLLSEHFCVDLEYGFRKTWTDYIDDVSTTYAGANAFAGNDLAARMADRSGEVREGFSNRPGDKRGDNSLDDWYAFFNISIAVSLKPFIKFFSPKRCG